MMLYTNNKMYNLVGSQNNLTINLKNLKNIC